MGAVKGAGDRSVVRTFRLPHVVAAEKVCVVGEFNDWSRTAHPMERDDDGFVAHIPLEPGRSYRFRYLLDDERWENDWAADAYVPNEFGGEDSVADLTNADPADTADTAKVLDVADKPKPARKRAPAKKVAKKA